MYVFMYVRIPIKLSMMYLDADGHVEVRGVLHPAHLARGPQRAELEGGAALLVLHLGDDEPEHALLHQDAQDDAEHGEDRGGHGEAAVEGIDRLDSLTGSTAAGSRDPHQPTNKQRNTTTHRQRQDLAKGVVGSVLMSLSVVLLLWGVPGSASPSSLPRPAPAPLLALPSSSAEAAGEEA